MKINILFFLMIFWVFTAKSQNLTLFDVNLSSFPTINAKFYAFDVEGNQISNLNISDFIIYENSKLRPIISVKCPSPKPPIPISSVLVMDVSGSMKGNGIEIIKSAALAWIDILPSKEFECAISSFSDLNYLNQDLTNDKTKLISALDGLVCFESTNFDAALIKPPAGGILIAKSGKYKRVLVILTDGLPSFEPSTELIISHAKANNISIYCVCIDMNTPQFLKDITSKTGGLYFENITTKEAVANCYRTIQMTAKKIEPCTIVWESELKCYAEKKNVNLNFLQNNTEYNLSYQSPDSVIKKMIFNPDTLLISDAEPGISMDTIISVKALNSDFKITNIKSSNPAFSINPKSFNISEGQSQSLTITFLPPDSGYVSSDFEFENDKCATIYTVSGGFKGKQPRKRLLKLIQPNGGEKFVVGKDTVITWKGVRSDDSVKIEYSTNNGLSWLTISDNSVGLLYKWKIPKTISNQCLARVTAKAPELQFVCENGVVKIDKQVWMCKNLDVNCYRNGDNIPEIQDSTQWANFTSGAWRYYNNDPNNGRIYGKLYNWYAVNDPRGLAPPGWHIPTDNEWKVLEKFLGMDDQEAEKIGLRGTTEGGKLKSISSLWQDPNTGATNVSGFTANPGGYYYFAGGSFDLGVSAYWWTSTENSSTSAWFRFLRYSSSYIGRHGFDYLSNKSNGFSVRCIKD